MYSQRRDKADTEFQKNFYKKGRKGAKVVKAYISSTFLYSQKFQAFNPNDAGEGGQKKPRNLKWINTKKR